MAETIGVYNFVGSSPTNATIVSFPDTCPRCHRHIQPVHRRSFYLRNESDLEIDSIYQCTSAECGRLFIAEYGRSSLADDFSLTRSSPYEPAIIKFSGEIAALSPTFSEIYNQALQAEALGLTHVAGMGYGKALEFLIKDFAIKYHPDEAESIKSKFLGVCINTYISDQNVQAVAVRAAWLRNDESHYVRKWSNKDIEDLKNLVRLTLNAIENVELAEKYKAEMPNPAK